LSLVPNPASTKVNLLWKGDEAEFEVVDAIGRVIENRKKLSSGTQLQTSNWPAGLYQVRAISSNGLESKPLQIMK